MRINHYKVQEGLTELWAYVWLNWLKGEKNEIGSKGSGRRKRLGDDQR